MREATVVTYRVRRLATHRLQPRGAGHDRGARVTCPQEARRQSHRQAAFAQIECATDSPLEVNGFELSVPRQIANRFTSIAPRVGRYHVGANLPGRHIDTAPDGRRGTDRIRFPPAASETKWPTRHQLAGRGHDDRHDKGIVGLAPAVRECGARGQAPLLCTKPALLRDLRGVGCRAASDLTFANN